MAHYSKLFSKVPLAVQNVSGFDLSHENLFTAKCGTLVPCYVQPCIPNTKLTLSLSTEIQLPPMATDFYGKVDGVFEAFFVPYRLLYGGWQEFITRPVNNAVYPSGTPESSKPRYLPFFKIPRGYYGFGSLADNLGIKINETDTPVSVLNPLPFLAYHFIYDSWYRNSFVQSPVFSKDMNFAEDSPNYYAYQIPNLSFPTDSPFEFRPLLADDTNLFQLRQRNWAKDYFTSATPLPQAGTDVKIQINTEDNSFTWGQLVAQNSLARWMQRTNIAGYRYPDQILAGFGVLPPDAIMDRPIYLGRKIVPIYNKSVYQNSGSSGESSNPFKTVAAKFGAPLGVGNGSLINRFHAKEHGIFMVLFSMVPRAYYSTGTSRHYKAQTMADFPHPDFANMGDQPIYVSELINQRAGSVDSTFAYQSKDSHYKYIDDQVHGELRDGGSLSMFALQRSFEIVPELSSSFLEIPTDFMDQVAAVDGDVSKYGCWVDVHFKAKCSMPLPAASIPTLTDPKDVHTVMVDKGGRTL